MSETTVPQEAEVAVDLKDPALAAFLAWLLPGLGHFYQGRTAKAVLFFVCILGTFLFGLYLGSSETAGWGRVVYASWRPDDKRLPYLCQVGVGLPALPALVQTLRVRNGRAPLPPKQFMAPPPLQPGAGAPTLNQLHRQLGRYFELGTVYTMVAGLLNVLAIYDAWGGPVVAHRQEDEEGEQKKEQDKDEHDG